MITRTSRLLGLGLAVVLGAACDGGDDGAAKLPPGTPTEAEVAQTPRADVLAERLALRCQDALIADEARYAAIKRDLDAIAAVRGARPTDHFTEAPLSLYLDLPPDVDARLLSGGDPAFDALNDRLRATVHDRPSVRASLGDAGLDVLFVGEYRADAVWALYAAVLGLDGPPATSAIVGDGDTIAYDLTAEPHLYVVSIGSGDCPSGCMFHTQELWTVDEQGAASLVADLPGGRTVCRRDGLGAFPRR
ncbi:MAG: hypothetical protein H6745_04915 [Deltaproteobacteria bacterium]|nr:hypothetical protein [Deltaproteobacteria bacterium]